VRLCHTCFAHGTLNCVQFSPQFLTQSASSTRSCAQISRGCAPLHSSTLIIVREREIVSCKRKQATRGWRSPVVRRAVCPGLVRPGHNGGGSRCARRKSARECFCKLKSEGMQAAVRLILIGHLPHHSYGVRSYLARWPDVSEFASFAKRSFFACSHAKNPSSAFVHVLACWHAKKGPNWLCTRIWS
jgi:hypothetical protein